MKVRRELMQTRSETGTQWREPLRHTRAVCRRAEHGDTARRSRVSALAAEASEIMLARVTASTSPIGHTYTYILTGVLTAYESLEINP
jgi:hypothetical protein